MGEIGIPRREFLYELQFWEVRRIIRGYRNRYHDLWSATRWQTYNIMCTGMADIKKAGIHGPKDLIEFPWEEDKPDAPALTEDEREELVQMMCEMNSKANQ